MSYSSSSIASSKDSSFTECRLWEYLQKDSRPTIAVDSHALGENLPMHGNCFIFLNDSLLDDKAISSKITSLLTSPATVNGRSDEDLVFQSLVLGKSSASARAWNILWSVTLTASRWRIISGTQLTQPLRSSIVAEDFVEEALAQRTDSAEGILVHAIKPTPAPAEDTQTTHKPQMDAAANDSHGLVDVLNSQPSTHQQRFQEFPWASTAVGAVSSWPEALRMVTQFLLVNPTPATVLWGPSRTMIYNENYTKLIRDLHPFAFGQPAANVLKKDWRYYEAICREVERTGRTVSETRAAGPLIENDGAPRETFFTYDFVPIFNKDGAVCCIYNQGYDVTADVFTGYRNDTLLKMNEAMNMATNVPEFWQIIVEELRTNAGEFPVAAVYSIGYEALVASFSELDIESKPGYKPHEKGGESIFSVDQWILEGSIGFPEDHKCVPRRMSVTGEEGLSSPFHQIASSTKVQNTILSMTDGVVAATLLDGCDDRGLGFQCSQLALCPLQQLAGGVVAWLVLGINPRRAVNEDYLRFIELMTRHMESKLALVLTLEREKKRAFRDAEDAAHQQERLSLQLQQRIREARESDLRFIKFAMNSPVGVYVLGPEGEIQFCNEAWRNLIGIESDNASPKAWVAGVHPDDKERVDMEWQRLVNGHIQKAFEWRVIRPASSLNGGVDDIVYLQSSSFPELGDDGKLTSVTGLSIDMSILKAYQRSQSEKLADALEAKRAQEYFMDMVSHEMRNPLNAIIQCTEETLELLSDLKHDERTNIAVRNITEVVNTILYCGIHQKQLIDDVLTLSKLDSNLLSVSPIEAEPANLLKQATKIYQSEIRASRIRLFTKVDHVSNDNHSHTVMVDTNRIIQILINLISNAIKFMKGRDKRELHVSVQVSQQRPLSNEIQFISSGRNRSDPTSGSDWGAGEVVYLYFSVRDTGVGLTDSEMKTLFARFQQASPRTHVTYGGSGLGLFISRELAEFHGGEIGIASQVDQGSTFAFYVKGRRPVSKTGSAIITQAGNDGLRARARSRSIGHTNSDVLVPILRGRSAASTTSQNIHVLVVEDNEINQKVLKRQLLKLGYIVTTANHGGEALSILQTSTWWQGELSNDSGDVDMNHSDDSRPDLSIILCDLEMPTMDGKTCVRQIRKWQSDGLLYQHIPVIAVTGNARAERTLISLEDGFDDVVSKPYSVESLVQRFSTLINTPSFT